MISIRVDEDELVEMLVDRLRDYWTQDREVIELYRQMYESMVDCFDGCEVNIMEIVDNDYVNYCSVIDESDEFYNEALEAIENDEYEFGNYRVEAYSDDKNLILIRYC